MEPSEREALTSQEMVTAARREIHARGKVSTSGEMVAAAHGSLPATDDVRDVPVAPEDETADIPRARTQATTTRPRPPQRQSVPPLPLMVPQRRLRRSGVLVGLAVIGLLVAIVVTSESSWFGSLGDELADAVSTSPAATDTIPSDTLIDEISGSPVPEGVAGVASGDVILDADVTGSILLTPGSSLDCDGHSIAGTGSGVGVGMAEDSTVRNCLIAGFNTGVGLSGSIGATVESVTVARSRVGFYLVNGTAGATIRDSTAESNEIGFLFEPSVVGAHIEGNVAARNWRSGFMVGHTTDSTFISNHVIGGGSGFWITRSTSNIFRENRVENATEWFSFGVFEGASGNTFEDNEVERGGVAFALGAGTSKNLLRGNSALDSSKGFDLSGGARINELIDNIATGTHDGFWTGDDAGAGNVMTGNLAQDSENWGFVDLTTGGRGDHGTANSYSDNECLRNGNASTPSGLC